MLEMFMKYLLETKSKHGLYSRTHQLNKLLEELIEYTDFKTNKSSKSSYRIARQVITVCAEEYRYHFLIDCAGYRDSVQIANELLQELLNFEKT
jgi:hypothetical protein